MTEDWHPEDIKAAIRKTGVSLSALSSSLGFTDAAVRQVLARPWPRLQALIAEHLGMQPHLIWPSRYDAAGQPLRRVARRNTIRKPTPAHTHRKTGDAA